MTDEWSKGDSDEWYKADTPYQDWWHRIEGIKTEEGPESYKAAFVPSIPEAKGKEPERLRTFMPRKTVGQNHDQPCTWKFDQVETALRQVENPPEKEAVIVGIVDAGIALGHRRFRRKTGETRFLASWQQCVEHGGLPSLPFGQELYEHDINDLLRTHSGGNLLADLDEDAFNREARLVVPDQPWGHRSLDYRAAHGTHVLDLAAGFDPEKTSDEDLKLNRIIAVNLPPRKVHGTAGNFLAPLAQDAVARILFLADALWAAHFPNEPGGFRVVINFSFGMLAGPKDGSSPWEQAIREMVRERDVDRNIPTRVVMPAGNTNLSRGNARKMIGMEDWATRKKGTESKKIWVSPCLTVPWRIHPSDHTSNFVEIWAKARSRETGDAAPEISAKDFRLWVTPPHSSEKLEVPQLGPGQFADLSDFARIYCYQPTGQKRPHFVICTAPTISYEAPNVEAPAGLWRISLRFPKHETEQNFQIIHEATFTVQSDQSGLLHAVTGRQSYFDHSDYRGYDNQGRVLDSYAPGEDREAYSDNLEPWDKTGPVQRKGTQNALATWKEVIVVGGYRISDGKPARYSSTFDGNSRREEGREAPSVLFPSEDGAAHFGLLAAGSKDGSVVALSGTSMASALATRDIALALSVPRNGTEHYADEDWLQDCAEEYWNGNPKLKPYHKLKQGDGPVQPLQTRSREVLRFGGS